MVEDYSYLYTPLLRRPGYGTGIIRANLNAVSFGWEAHWHNHLFSDVVWA
jgi:hypothetical protein